jgi:hypothetical protein
VSDGGGIGIPNRRINTPSSIIWRIKTHYRTYLSVPNMRPHRLLNSPTRAERCDFVCTQDLPNALILPSAGPVPSQSSDFTSKPLYTFILFANTRLLDPGYPTMDKETTADASFPHTGPTHESHAW